MKKLVFFCFCLLVYLTPFAQPSSGGSGPGIGDCDIPCVDLSVHFVADAEVMNYFNNEVEAVGLYVLAAFDGASELLSTINVNLVLDGFTPYFGSNPWGPAPALCEEYRKLLGTQAVLFEHSADITYVLTSPKDNCFGAASGIGTYCDGENLSQCGQDGSEGRDWLIGAVDSPDPVVTLTHEIGHILGSDDLEDTDGIMASNFRNRKDLVFKEEAREQICEHLSACRGDDCDIEDILPIKEVFVPCESNKKGCIDLNVTTCMRTGLTYEDPFGIIDFDESTDNGSEICSQICYDLGSLSAAFIVVKYDHCGSGTSSKILTFRDCTENFFPPNPPMELANIYCDDFNPSAATVCIPFPDCVTEVSLGDFGQVGGLYITTTHQEICITPLFCLNKTYQVNLVPTFFCSEGEEDPVTWSITVNSPEICSSGIRQEGVESPRMGMDDKLGQSLHLSPNPFGEVLNLYLDLPRDEFVNGYRLFDGLGKEVRQTTKPIYGGRQHLIYTHLLPAGIYYLSVETKEGKLVEKVVKR
ncbi:MAG: T9SS type A sorting domain-containing protein [Bacteroidota bacterium]